MPSTPNENSLFDTCEYTSLSALEEAHVMNHILFQMHGFFGHQSQQLDPDLGYISNLLDSKKGNSLSLGILYLILAQKNELPISPHSHEYYNLAFDFYVKW